MGRSSILLPSPVDDALARSHNALARSRHAAAQPRHTPAPPRHATGRSGPTAALIEPAARDILAAHAAATGRTAALRLGPLMAAYTVRTGDPRGELVAPQAVSPALADLVGRIQRVPWPQWLEPGVRMRREVAELCRLQAARGLTVLSWLADGSTPGDIEWLLNTQRLTGPRQQRMYGAAERLPDPVRGLVVANWTWALSTPLGGRVTAPYFASRAYPDDGYAAAHATVTLLQLWERVPEVRQALAAAWAATRTPADWCKAAELRASYGGDVPIFTYPRGPVPPRAALRPWISRLLRCE